MLMTKPTRCNRPKRRWGGDAGGVPDWRGEVVAAICGTTNWTGIPAGAW